MNTKSIKTRRASKDHFRRIVFYVVEIGPDGNEIESMKVCAIEQTKHEDGYAEPLLEFDTALVQIPDLPLVQYAFSQAIALAHEWEKQTAAKNALASSIDLVGAQA